MPGLDDFDALSSPRAFPNTIISPYSFKQCPFNFQALIHQVWAVLLPLLKLAINIPVYHQVFTYLSMLYNLNLMISNTKSGYSTI